MQNCRRNRDVMFWLAQIPGVTYPGIGKDGAHPICGTRRRYAAGVWPCCAVVRSHPVPECDHNPKMVTVHHFLAYDDCQLVTVGGSRHETSRITRGLQPYTASLYCSSANLFQQRGLVMTQSANQPESNDNAATTGNKPADKFREGPVHVSIWEKQGVNGPCRLL